MRNPEQSDLIERTKRAGVEFLFTDLEMASAFLHVGETSTSRETRDRNQVKALQGYRTVLHFFSEGGDFAGPKHRSQGETSQSEESAVAGGYFLRKLISLAVDGGDPASKSACLPPTSSL